MVILVVFGDFSVFSVIFVVHICHICCHICIIFFTQFLFTPGGNFGPKCDARAARLVVKNGFFRKK